MTLGDTPKISFSQKCRKSLRIYNYGFCFRKWRSMTLPNGPGFCFQKWRSVRYPDFWLFSTLTFNIVTWWRHTCDVTSCTYTLTDTLSATYDVTVLSPCVTSQVTKIYFWILFPWMTLGENPKMLPIWVKDDQSRIFDTKIFKIRGIRHLAALISIYPRIILWWCSRWMFQSRISLLIARSGPIWKPVREIILIIRHSLLCFQEIHIIFLMKHRIQHPEKFMTSNDPDKAGIAYIFIFE